MSEIATAELHNQLRAWAKGMYPLEAATELLIRTRWAGDGLPWIRTGDQRRWIDFEAITDDHIGAYSGGEQRLLRLAASIAGATPADLSEVAGLDRHRLDLVLAAIAHAGGSHEHSGFTHDETGRPLGITRYTTLHAWPDENTHNEEEG